MNCSDDWVPLLFQNIIFLTVLYRPIAKAHTPLTHNSCVIKTDILHQHKALFALYGFLIPTTNTIDFFCYKKTFGRRKMVITIRTKNISIFMCVSVWWPSGCQYKVQCLWDKLIFVTTKSRPLILCPWGTACRVNEVNVLLTPWQRLKGAMKPHFEFNDTVSTFILKAMAKKFLKIQDLLIG